MDALTICNGCEAEPMLDNPMGYGADCLAETTSCTLWVGPEDRCGERAVAWDRDADEPRCEAHTPEHLWRECDGWVPEHKSPLTLAKPATAYQAWLDRQEQAAYEAAIERDTARRFADYDAGIIAGDDR